MKHLRIYGDMFLPEDALTVGKNEEDDGLCFEALEQGQQPSAVSLSRDSVEELRDFLSAWLRGKV